jgi:hypothetical protein
MKKRLLPVLTLIFIAGMAIAADKKSSSATKLVRTEGKVEEFLLNPTGVSTEQTATWDKATDTTSNSDDPVLEFTSADPKSLSLELEFDTLDSKENVYEKFIRSLENLTLIDSDLKRPPMVKVVWGQAGGLPAFGGVVSSVSTKYTMFLPDGVPVRATCSVKMKQASTVRVKKSDG